MSRFLIAAFLTLVLGIAVFAYLRVDTPDIFVFATQDGVPAVLSINGEEVGPMPVTIRRKDLDPRFDSAISPSSWPPVGYAVSSDIKGLEVFVARPKDGESDGLFYFRHGDTRGAMRIRVANAAGKFGHASGISWSTENPEPNINVMFFFPKGEKK